MFILTPIFTIISCTIWLLIRKKASLSIDEQDYKYKNLILIYFLIYVSSIFVYYTRSNLYERPIIYIFLICIMVSIIFLQIISLSSKYSSIILIEIIFLAINIVWCQLFMYPELLGFDPWVHRKFTLDIINSNFIPINFVYSKLPIFHLLVAETSLITNLDYKYATMASISFSTIVGSVLFIYLISKFLLKNEKVACLSALLLIIGNYFIYMSFWSIPNGFAIIFILISFYLILKLKTKFHIKSTSLSMIFMGIVVLTHTIAASFMCILLFVFRFAYSLAEKFYNKLSTVPYSFYYPILFLVLMLTWWTYVSGHIGKLSQLLSTSFSIDNFNYDPQNIDLSLLTLYSPTVHISELVFNYIGMLLFFALSFVGFFYMISKKYGDHLTFSYSFAAISPLVISFLSLVLSRSILEHRWMYFSQIMLSILFAVTIILIYNSFNKKRFISVCLSIFLFLITFNLILTPSSSCDNHIFNPNTTYRYSLMTSEHQAIQTVMQIWDGSVDVDTLYQSEQPANSRILIYDKHLLDKNFTSTQQDLLLSRQDIKHKTFLIFTIISILDYDLDHLLEQQNYSKMYDCGTVTGFRYVI